MAGIGHRVLVIAGSAAILGVVTTAGRGAAQTVEGTGESGPAAVLGEERAGAPVYTHAAPRARAVRATESIEVDGRLEEAGWAAAPVIDTFTQLDPEEGAPGTERTEVRIAYDDGAIYVGAMLYDSGPVSTRLVRRDGDFSNSDAFAVILDSFHDHQTAYSFRVNPSGVQQDAVISGGGGRGDQSWDPVWEVATRVTEEGWVVELRIPFSQLRFSRASRQSWGIQLERTIHRKQEETIFAFTPKLERGGVPAYGHLEGLEEIRPARRLELLPFVSARAEYREIAPAAEVAFDNPFRSGSDYFGDAGLDLKYGITSNLTLDATVNPDFGQVEVDPAVINLTAFETRFEERRPFFVEGADIFRFAEGGPAGSTGRPPQLLYSRRIGRAPQVGVPGSAVFSDAPSTTTILGAAKLTGRTPNGWSVGVLEAITGRETATYVDALGGRDEAPVEPRTNYFVGRLRRDLRGGQTRLGFIATSVHRQLDDPPLESRLRGSAYSAGFDFVHEWSNRAWRLNGAFAPSYVTGSAAAMLLTQRASARYYQRPDADHLELDPAATSLGGYYAMIDLLKQAGAFQAKVALAGASPGYEANDLGFQTAADRIILDTNFSYMQPRPGRFLRRWDVRGSPDGIWNYGGDMVFAEVNTSGSFTLLNYWGGGARLAYNPSVHNDRLTRGGPLSRDPAGHSANFNISSDSRKAYVGRVSFDWASDEGGSWSRGANLNLSYRLGSNWDFRVGPSWNRSYTAAQYVATVADPVAAHTFGRRYVFAGIDQTTLALESRVNVTFTPSLSFQLYAQPFFSAGDYDGLKELRRPGEFAFLRYGSDVGTIERDDDHFFSIDPDGAGPSPRFRIRDADFNYRSVRGNAVLRWEWRPGSTLFLVWQQGREDRLTAARWTPGGEPVGRFDLNRDVRELMELRADHILQIKFNYWLNP
ncbi:MAG TPA: DUF5916 domain-containing protein [Longimicrobiaceae bacterium]|nr:DUF5916 domain-containing protein [Longimicrobiaceae bacterium]